MTVTVGFKTASAETRVMSSIELTPSQKTILQELINLHKESESAVKGEDIAEEVNRNPGTIRNQMQSLKALQLVEGVPGPKGGYKPTGTAYDALQIQDMDQAADVPLYHNGELIDEANVEQIDLTSVHHPEECRAKINMRGSLSRFTEGDKVTVGPTPLSKLQIIGTLEGKDDTDNALILTIDDMQAPVGEPEH
ncbi:MAG: putative transcriptional regulator [Natronomonas sp.]|jgi:predicted transcriptional regulator